MNAGKVTTWFAEQAEVGDIIEFGQPFGDMTLPEQDSPLLLLAAGSGITPMLSMLEALKDKAELVAPVTLWYWVKKTRMLLSLRVLKSWHKSFQTFLIRYLQLRNNRLRRVLMNLI